MPARVAPNDTEVQDLEVLIRAHHPLIVLETEEAQRGATLIEWVADRLNLPYVTWQPEGGLTRRDVPSFEVEGSADPGKCLDHILSTRTECLYHLQGFEHSLEDRAVVHKLLEVCNRLFDHRGAVIMTSHGMDVPTELSRVVTSVQLSAPSPEQYHAFITTLFRDMQKRMPLVVKLSGKEVEQLISKLQGLTLFEVKKILTKLLVEDGEFTGEDIGRLTEAKREIVARSGVLEYFPTEESMASVAGLSRLKEWLASRKLAFTDPVRAKSFGLTPPRGMLLLGVQGCGKSLCAKATSSEWQLPLIRLDPSNLYNKYMGESERNLKRAIKTAESMAPIVLWIDEIEKAFAQGGDNDSGTGTRIFGTFLQWLQEKPDGVFVIATSNDISKLPPELMRKGRFDEIFFVDLPDELVRQQILAVHLGRKQRDPGKYDLKKLAVAMDGFSGAEIEQVVLSGMYTAFAQGRELQTRDLLEEIQRTVPLSVTASEKIQHLRKWASERAVPAQ